VLVGRPEILLVDDDIAESYEVYFGSALCSLGLLYDTWEVMTKGNVGGEILKYPVAIWCTGQDSTTTLDSTDFSNLSRFLNAGGSLCITGQNLGEDVGNSGFYANYLHARFVGTASGDYFVSGIEDDEIGDGLSFVIRGDGGASNQTSQDILFPIDGADSIFSYKGGGGAAIKYGDAYKVVYLGFGFEAINDLAHGYSSRADCLREILDWFGIEVGLEEVVVRKIVPGNGRITVNPNPSEGRISVSYSIHRDSFTTMNLYNASGRFIENLFEGYERRGFHTRSYSLSLPSGMYFLEVKTGDLRNRTKFILMR
jgi:hypothetical protein